MSDGGKNVGKSRSRVPDVRESRSQYGDSSSRGSAAAAKSVEPKKGYSEDEFFDSGIQSECCLSSETDLKYGDSALDCSYDSRSFDKEDDAEEERSSKDSSSRELPKSEEVDYKSQASKELDSGLDLKYEPPRESPETPWDKFFEPDDEGNT